MAAPKGNKYAVGNSGGKSYGKPLRKKAAKIKGMLLDEIEKALKGKDIVFKKQIILRLASVCFPQELTGEDGQPIKIVFDSVFKK